MRGESNSPLVLPDIPRNSGREMFWTPLITCSIFHQLLSHIILPLDKEKKNSLKCWFPDHLNLPFTLPLNISVQWELPLEWYEWILLVYFTFKYAFYFVSLCFLHFFTFLFICNLLLFLSLLPRKIVTKRLDVSTLL